MVKVFVAQTQKKDRDLLCDFLAAAGHDVASYATDPLSRVFLAQKMSFMTKPFVLASSQRDDFGCNYVSNILHAVTLTMPMPTLTIVYSRAVGHQEHMPGVIKYLADLTSIPEYRLDMLSPQEMQLEMMNIKRHPIKMVPKLEEGTVIAEHETILSYIKRFAQEPQ